MTMNPAVSGDVRPVRSWQGLHGEMALQQVAPGVVLLRIAGHDVGEFGSGPMLELERHLAETGTIELFVDARATVAASLDVSGAWARWLGDNRHRCARITMLTGSRFIDVTARFVRRFAGLGDIMHICSDAEPFERHLGAAVVRATGGR